MSVQIIMLSAGLDWYFLQQLPLVCHKSTIAAQATTNSHKLATLDSLCWFSQHYSRTQVLCARCVRCHVSSDRIALFTFCIMHQNSAKCTFFGDAHPWGAMTPKLELGRSFCTMHLPPSFIILCLLVRKLLCWQTNTHTQTHTQTRNRFCWKHPTFFAMLWRG